MNLIFRMLWVWWLSRRRERLPVGVAESRLRLMTLPTDLDIKPYRDERDVKLLQRMRAEAARDQRKRR